MGKTIQNYNLQNEIGRGMYSTVFKGINIKTKQQVAIKMVKTQKFKQYPKLQQGTYNQINILSTLQPCPHIIKYFDMLKTANNYYFVYEYCNGGTLQKLLKEKGSLPQKAALVYFAQMMEAFRILSRHNIMHRDLKPENLLLHDGMIKLADFGFCKPLENEDEISKTMLGSPIYMAPEVLRGEPYSIKADIWSLGVVLFRMVYGFCPFQSNNIGKLIMMMEEEDIVIPSQPRVSPELTKLMRRMITKNPAMRADWSEVFSYQIKNGELLRVGVLRDRTPKNNLKRSFTLTETTNANSTSNSQNLQASMRSRREGSQILYNPRVNSDLRSTYTAKSPFRQNMKKDIMVKNHLKCLETMALATSLTVWEGVQPLALAYVVVKNVDKELLGVLDTARKEHELKSQEATRNFIAILEAEVGEIKALLIQLREELRGQLQFSIQLIDSKKRDLLKRFLTKMPKDSIQDLVLASRIVDYIIDELVIRKETFEKLSKEKLMINLKTKIDAL